jgi:hypothetical protein
LLSNFATTPPDPGIGTRPQLIWLTELNHIKYRGGKWLPLKQSGQLSLSSIQHPNANNMFRLTSFCLYALAAFGTMSTLASPTHMEGKRTITAIQTDLSTVYILS